MQFFCKKILLYQNKVLPLQRQTKKSIYKPIKKLQVMTRANDLKKYCSANGLQLTKCKKNGCYLVDYTTRPDSSTFATQINCIKKIGYNYCFDNCDQYGYYIVISADKKFM